MSCQLKITFQKWKWNNKLLSNWMMKLLFLRQDLSSKKKKNEKKNIQTQMS